MEMNNKSNASIGSFEISDKLVLNNTPSSKYHPYKPPTIINNPTVLNGSSQYNGSYKSSVTQNRAVSPTHGIKSFKYSSNGNSNGNRGEDVSFFGSNSSFIDDFQSEEELFEKFNFEHDITSNSGISDSDIGSDKFYRRVLMVLIGLVPKSILSQQQQTAFQSYCYLLLNHEYKLILDQHTNTPLRSSLSKEFDGSNTVSCIPNAKFKQYRLGYRHSSTSQRIYNVPLFVSQIKHIIIEHHSRGDVHYSVEETHNHILDSRWFWHFLRESIQKLVLNCDCNRPPPILPPSSSSSSLSNSGTTAFGQQLQHQNLKQQKFSSLYNNQNNGSPSMDTNDDIVNILKTVVNNQNIIQKQLNSHQKSLQSLSAQQQHHFQSSPANNILSPSPFSVYNPNSQSHQNNSQNGNNDTVNILQSYLSNFQVMLQGYFDQQNQVLFGSLDQIKNILLNQQQQQPQPNKYSPPQSFPPTKPSFVNISPFKPQQFSITSTLKPTVLTATTSMNGRSSQNLSQNSSSINSSNTTPTSGFSDPETISDETSSSGTLVPSTSLHNGRGMIGLDSSQNEITITSSNAGGTQDSFTRSQTSNAISSNVHGSASSNSSSGDLSPPSSPTMGGLSPSQEIESHFNNTHIQLLSSYKYNNNNNNNNTNTNNNNGIYSQKQNNINNIISQSYQDDDDDQMIVSSNDFSNQYNSNQGKTHSFDFNVPYDGDPKKKERDRKKISNFKDTLFKTFDESLYQSRKELYFSMVANFNEYYGKYSPSTRLVRIDDDFPQTVGEIDEYLRAHNYSSKKRDDKKNKNKIEQANNANILAKQKSFLVTPTSSQNNSLSPSLFNNNNNNNNNNNYNYNNNNNNNVNNNNSSNTTSSQITPEVTLSNTPPSSTTPPSSNTNNNNTSKIVQLL